MSNSGLHAWAEYTDILDTIIYCRKLYKQESIEWELQTDMVGAYANKNT